MSEQSCAASYFQEAIDAFSTAKIRRRHMLSVAGQRIRLEFAHADMERVVMPAFAHLEVVDERDCDLTISIWDSASSNLPSLSPVWNNDAYGRGGLIKGFNSKRFHTAVQIGPTIFRMIDFEQRRAIYWTPDAAQMPYWEIGAPLRPLLHEWFQRQGFFPVHGGAVGFEIGGVLLAGAGGRGKSNVALSCLAGDLLYASDDFCVLSSSPNWAAHSLYCTGKIAAADRGRHPHLEGLESNPEQLGEEKALYFLNRHFPEKLIGSMPLRAIVMPRVVGAGRSQLIPASTADAQKAIAMSTIELSRWTAAETFAKTAALVRCLPCFELQIGSDIADVPPLLGALIRTLAPRSRGDA